MDKAVERSSGKKRACDDVLTPSKKMKGKCSDLPSVYEDTQVLPPVVSPEPHSADSEDWKDAKDLGKKPIPTSGKEKKPILTSKLEISFPPAAEVPPETESLPPTSDAKGSKTSTPVAGDQQRQGSTNSSPEPVPEDGEYVRECITPQERARRARAVMEQLANDQVESADSDVEADTVVRREENTATSVTQPVETTRALGGVQPVEELRGMIENEVAKCSSRIFFRRLMRRNTLLVFGLVLLIPAVLMVPPSAHNSMAASMETAASSAFEQSAAWFRGGSDSVQVEQIVEEPWHHVVTGIPGPLLAL